MQCTRAEPYIWTTQNGRVIPVPELDDDHLKNIFNMIRGKERFNFGIFSEMVERKLWDADQGVLARYELRHHSAPRTLNGTIVPGFQEVCDHEGACACQKVHETLGL